jgi:hypothetical protein
MRDYRTRALTCRDLIATKRDEAALLVGVPGTLPHNGSRLTSKIANSIPRPCQSHFRASARNHQTAGEPSRIL